MSGLKLGKAQNEVGKNFFASDLLNEMASQLFWGNDIIFNQSNFHIGSSFTGNGSEQSPFDWKGIEAKNSSGTTISASIKVLKSGIGTTLNAVDGVLSFSVDLSSYSTNSISIAGNSSKLILNGLWSLQDGSSTKLASENSYVVYLFSSDLEHEYPTLKAKSNHSGADRNFLLLESNGKIPLSARVISTSSTPGEVIVNGGNLSLDASGKISWSGFSALNSSGSSISSSVKTIKAGDNISFSISGNALVISSTSSGESIVVDSALNGSSLNPVQNKIVTQELNKKITNPAGAQNGQFLSWNGSSFVWATPPSGGGTTITVDADLDEDSTNPVQNSIVTKELAKKITNPSGASAGQYLCWTGQTFAWRTPSTSGGSGVNIGDILAISKIVFQRPVSDKELFPRVIGGSEPDFSGVTMELNTQQAPECRSYFEVFDGENWIPFPTNSGLGTPYDGAMIALNASVFSESLTIPFYVKYCWSSSDGQYESPYESTFFPSIHTFSPEKENTQTVITSSVSNLLITRPATDLALFPIIESSVNPDFSNSIEVNSFQNSTQRQNYFKAFNGSEWQNIPNDGLGTPFDDMPISVSMTPFSSLEQPFYVRYKWVTTDGIETNYKSTIFPSSGASQNIEQESEKEDVLVDSIDLDENGCYTLPGIKLGTFIITQEDGKVISPDIYKTANGIKIDFANQDSPPWNINFI